MRRRFALPVAAALAGIAIAAVAFSVLRPSSSAAPRAPTADAVALVAPAKRKPLRGLAEEVVNPPPKRIDLGRLRGPPAFLSVWASWCPSCEEEAPMIARLAGEFRGRVRFVGIDVEDTRDPDASVATRLGVYGIPTMFLVDRQGRIAATLVGKQGAGKLRRALRALASER